MRAYVAISMLALLTPLLVTPDVEAQLVILEDPEVVITAMNLPNVDPWVRVTVRGDITCEEYDERNGGEIFVEVTCTPDDRSLGCYGMDLEGRGTGGDEVWIACNGISIWGFPNANLGYGCNTNVFTGSCGINVHPNSYKVKEYVCKITLYPYAETGYAKCLFEQ